jgi:mRNA interferase MazF
MTRYERGDVLPVRFPDSNLLTFKTRPVLLIGSQKIQTALSQQIVAMITSNIERSGPTRRFVPRNSAEGRTMGLRTDSVIVLDNIATIH